MSSSRAGDAIDIGSPNQKARHLSTGVTSLNVSKSNESTVFVPAVRDPLPDKLNRREIRFHDINFNESAVSILLLFYQTGVSRSKMKF